MGYKTSADILATRVQDGTDVNVNVAGLHLFSSGAFSNVYRGTLGSETQQPREIVIKKTWTSAKERKESPEVGILKLLNRLCHKNVVRLLYTFSTKHVDKVCYSLIFEFLPMNLYQYLKEHNRKLALIETKMFAWQMFRGQYHLQRASICHRDLKPQNILVDPESGLLKIGDFGSSAIDPEKCSQPSYHVTRYYRPPELLLGSKHYGTEIDIWSAGCIMGEMMKGSVLFPGKNSSNQMELILDCFGLPTDDEVTSMLVNKNRWKETRMAYLQKRTTPLTLAKVIPTTNREFCTDDALKLLNKVLVYNPHMRLCGQHLLEDSFWSELFLSDTVRPNGKPITCLSRADLLEVKRGDTSMTASSSQE